ncbi:g1191 [Coccomyxa viridis]|uniref:G1191 protein n=1 Tax=Coccomyxa viridis TaxID=1274662 RepID=A0ABP1FJ35_9CHLO
MASTSGKQHVAVLRGTKSAAIPLREREKPLAAYMTLPASQYSVLDAKQIERIDDSTFRCYVGGLRFLGFTIDPVLTVSVDVTEKGPTVRLLSTKLEGSPAVEAANDKFSATMENKVRWGSSAEAGFLELRSDTSIQVALEVPGWFRVVPVEAIEKTGSSVMQRILNRMVPRFLKQLQADYELWASGDDSRKPIAAGELSAGSPISDN